MKAVILKSELLVDTSFIFLFANCGRSSLKCLCICCDKMTGYYEISVACFLKIKLNIYF